MKVVCVAQKLSGRTAPVLWPLPQRLRVPVSRRGRKGHGLLRNRKNRLSLRPSAGMLKLARPN